MMRFPLDSTEFDPGLFAHFQSFLTENRKQKLRDVLSFRTRYITVLLEDISHAQNGSAIMRTCDLTGILDVLVVENKFKYEVNPDVAVGSTQWLNIRKYNQSNNNSLLAIRQLKAEGYRIVATSPHHEQFSPDTLPLDMPIAVIFGTEKEGVSATAIREADAFIRIPMVGFTESYNVSASAALILYTITKRMRELPVDWHLKPEEQNRILQHWSKISLRSPELIEQRYFQEISEK